MGVFLICFNLVAIFEIVRYIKTAVEFALSIIVVRNAGDKVSSDANKYFGTKRSAEELKSHLGDYLTNLDHFVGGLGDEKIANKISSTKQICELRSEIDAVREWHRSMPPGTASKEILKKRKTLEKLASALRSNVTVDGFYYPLGPDLRPFPEKSIFAQLLELLGQANSPESQSDKRSLWKRILFWRKNVYANDESGWILRETPRGWEIVPDALWEKEPEFAIELDEDAGAGRLPPSAGWTSVADGSAADLTIRIPLSCRNSLVVRNSPAKEAGADAPFTRKDDWVFENEFVEALSPKGWRLRGNFAVLFTFYDNAFVVFEIQEIHNK